MNEELQNQPTTGSALSKDTFADKAVRFGCGALLAGLVFVFLVIMGLGAPPFGVSGVVALGVLVVVTSGVLSVTFGERYLERLLKFIKWLG